MKYTRNQSGELPSPLMEYGKVVVYSIEGGDKIMEKRLYNAPPIMNQPFALLGDAAHEEAILPLVGSVLGAPGTSIEIFLQDENYNKMNKATDVSLEIFEYGKSGNRFILAESRLDNNGYTRMVGDGPGWTITKDDIVRFLVDYPRIEGYWFDPLYSAAVLFVSPSKTGGYEENRMRRVKVPESFKAFPVRYPQIYEESLITSEELYIVMMRKSIPEIQKHVDSYLDTLMLLVNNFMSRDQVRRIVYKIEVALAALDAKGLSYVTNDIRDIVDSNLMRYNFFMER